MVSLYVKGKENGHVQAYAPTGAMGLKRWGDLTSKLDGDPHNFNPTPTGEKPVRDENCLGIKLH